MAIAVAPIAMPRLTDSAVKPAPSIPVGKMMPTPGSDGDGVGMAVAPSGLGGLRAGVAAVPAGPGRAHDGRTRHAEGGIRTVTAGPAKFRASVTVRARPPMFSS